MKISVNKYTLEPETVNGGTAGSHGMEDLEFDFSPEWDGLCRTVTFFPPKSVAKCVSFAGSTVPLPPEVTRRAGKTSFVLCGARDGAAVITLTGVIKVEESLIPDEAQLTENTPGALEQAALMCAEARQDAVSAAAFAQSAALSADSAIQMREETQFLRDEVAAHREEVSELYDTVIEGTNVHAAMTEANCSDRKRAVSAAGVNDRLEALLKVISPFNIKAVDSLPQVPDRSYIYLYQNTPKVYVEPPDKKTYYIWQANYSAGSGPVTVYSSESTVTKGTVLYWFDSGELVEEEQLGVYSEVNSDENGVFRCDKYGTVFTLTQVGSVDVEPKEPEVKWCDITAQSDLTPYLKDSPIRFLITGGAA